MAAADLDSNKDESCDTNAGSGLFSLFGGASSVSSAKAVKSTAGDGDDEDEDAEDVKKYAPFLFDFSYLHNPEEWEASLSIVESKTPPKQQQQRKSESHETLAELEREFAVNHRVAIEQYFELFYSIYDYQFAVNQFTADLNKGYFIQYTVESVLLDLEGRALLCEAVWLYGVMLIMMERFLPVRLSLVGYFGVFLLPLTCFSSSLLYDLRFPVGPHSRTSHHCVLSFLSERR